MDWLHHPKFIPVRDSVLADLKRKEYHFRKVGTVLFLCGGSESKRRERLAEYLERRRPDVLLFYAEAVWEVIAQQPEGNNALAVEEKLAALADIVVVIVESPGTYAELGAFSISEPLRKKLLPILDIEHYGKESFIETGPVRWVDLESDFSPSVWVRHDTILEAVDEVEDRIDRIPSAKAARVPELALSHKHLVFFISDLVSVFGPSSADHIRLLARHVMPGETEIDSRLFLGLGKAMKLLSSFTYDGVEMFFRPLENGRLRSFQYTRKYIDIPTLRARVLGVMQSCPPCLGVLGRLEEANAAT